MMSCDTQPISEKGPDGRDRHADAQAILDSVPAMVFYKDTENRILRVNEAYAAMMGKPRAQLEGRSLAELYPAEQAAACWKDDQEVIASGKPKTDIIECIPAETGVRWLQTDKIPYRDVEGNVVGVIGFSRDITDRKHREEQLAELLRFHAMLSEANKAIARIHSVPTLYSEVCRIVAQQGMFPLVWIGLKEATRVVSAAHSGIAIDSMHGLPIDLQGDAESEPAVTCIRENRPAVDNDISTGPPEAPWRKSALQHGFRASAAIPLRRQEEAIGALVVYASEPNVFDAQQMTLLESLGANLSHAIAALDNEWLLANAEHALRESLSLLRALTDNTTDAVCAKDRQSRWVMANPALLQIVGKTSDAVLGRHDGNIFTDRALASAILENDRHVLEREEPETFEETMQTARGIRVFLATKAPWRDAQGRVVGVVSVSRDITERRKAEDALHRTVERMELLSEAASQLLAAERPKEIVESLCSKVMSHLNCDIFLVFLLDDRQQRLHLNAFGGVLPEDAKQIEWMDVDQVECGCVVRNGASIIVEPGFDAADGPADIMHCLGLQAYACYPLFDQRQIVGTLSFGSHTKFAFSVDDQELMRAVTAQVTVAMQRLRLLESIEQRAIEAQAANEAKSRFLANVSHELRTPMNVILGMLDLALQRPLDTTAKDFLETARESADLLLALLGDLLDSVKIEAGKLELALAPFSLRHILDQLTHVLAVRASDKGIGFSCHTEADVPDSLIGDQVRLRQIVLNLAGNAIKFTDRGAVEVRVRVDSHTADLVQLEFIVRDTGVGIASADLQRIFRRFEQADLSTSRRFGGAGLGLSIASELVGLMHGRIWVDSEIGHGSAFHFTVQLPLAQGLPLPKVASRLSARPISTVRVLLAEDNPANRKLVAYVLRQRGHTVGTAENGQQAVTMLEQDDYDIVLMDVQMPIMDGLQASAAIRALADPVKAGLPIVALTAHAMSEDSRHCLAVGMNAYVSKPICAEELIELVERLTGSVATTPDLRHPTAEEETDVTGNAAESAVPAFELDDAMKRCFDNRMFGEMVDFFFTESAELMGQMHAALHNGNTKDVAAAAHRLRGTILYLGAAPAMEAAQRVETAGTSGDPASTAEAIRQLDAQLQILAQALDPYRCKSQS